MDRTDITYWHVVGSPNAWHADIAGTVPPEDVDYVAGLRVACGRYVGGTHLEHSDRLPDGHVCGSCSRVIVAKADRA